jgi:AraC-like DNA-binding protein
MISSLKIDPQYDGFLFLAETVRNPPILVSHRHREVELNLVVNGKITYVLDGRSYTFGRGSLLWFFPSQEHQIMHRTSDAQYYVGVFTPDMIQRACRSATYADLGKEDVGDVGILHSILEPARFDLMERMMAEIMEGSMDADLLNREAGFGVDSSFRYAHHDPDALNAGLRHLLLLAWRYQQTAGAHADSLKLHPSVRQALALISENPESESLGELARKCSVSEAYLSRLFRKQVGIPLSQYKNNIRLGRFWECYSRADSINMTEAMLEAGFGSYAQFYKVFRAQYGCGPRESLSVARSPSE